MSIKAEALSTGEYIFTFVKAPEIFPALHALSVDSFFKYSPVDGDYFYPLLPAQKKMARELNDFIMEYKTKAAIDANRGVNYSLKGKQVIRIASGDDLENYLSVKIIFKDKNEDASVIDKYLENEPDDLKTQARLHLTGCDANKCAMCSTFQSGNFKLNVKD